MIVRINGKDEELEAGSTIGDFLSARELSFDSVVVEVNGDIVSSEDYAGTLVGEKDVIEILRFVGGG